MKITIQTLTPLWTGGVDQTSDRLHETGLIGSLRWWYEALVRGLGGYACDPTNENPEARCTFDSQAYKKAKANHSSEEEAIRSGLKTICPVCYLFGATGWARLFQLRTVDIPTTPLHFRTTVPTNKGWLKRVFGGQQQSIDSINVPYGNLSFQLISRRHDEAYAKGQFALVLHLVAAYGGLGARLQHGFGQILFPNELNHIGLTDGLQQLQAIIQQGFLRSTGPAVDTPFDLRNFIGLTYAFPQATFRAFTGERSHVGDPQKKLETRYLPCVFDLRYKGQANWGMRQWLKQQGWKETSNPQRLEELDLLLGPRSQWGQGNRQQQIQEDLRTAGRVFFSMPYQQDGKYALRIWALWPPELHNKLSNPDSLMSLCKGYMQEVFREQPITTFFGSDILSAPGGLK